MRADGTIRPTLKNSWPFHDPELLPDIVFLIPKHRVIPGCRQLRTSRDASEATACCSIVVAEATVVQGSPTLMLDIDLGLVLTLVSRTRPSPPQKKGPKKPPSSSFSTAGGSSHQTHPPQPSQLVCVQQIEMSVSGRRARVHLRVL
jgi:hypothetical protein